MNFAGLKSAVKSYLNRTDLDDQIPNFINWALRKLESGDNFRYMLNETSGELSAEQEYIAVPTNMKSVHLLRIFDANVSGDAGIVANPTSYDLFTGMSQTKTYDKPTTFAVYMDKIYLYPIPDVDARYSYVLSYYKFTPAFSADEDTNALSESDPQVLIYGALMEAEPYLLNDQRLITWKALYEEALSKLRNADLEYTRPRGWIIANGVDV